MNIIDTPGRVPYAQDSTRQWVEQVGREDGLLKPQLALRFASDTNYVRSAVRSLYADHPRGDARTRAMMNIALPGMRVPGVINWQVTEASDQIVQTASFEAFNCLPISTTFTELTSYIPATPHLSTITTTHVRNSFGVMETVYGDTNVEYHRDSDGYSFLEDNVQFRTFAFTPFDVADASQFPNPAIPNDDDNDIPDDTIYPSADNGAGSYFVLIDNEIIRVCALSGNTFSIPPGGRAVNGILEFHAPGATVHLLGYGPYTGDAIGSGYMNVDDFNPQKAFLRPGTCLTSYEGYGTIHGPLTHTYDPARNYTFTGYWFVNAVEPSITSDGTPRVKVSLQSVGTMYDKQKITPDLTRRIGDASRYGKWKEQIFSLAGHNRNIPGDWVDYNQWDPTLPGSYPLQIKTEMAQNKAFADHMKDTNFGLQCEICRKENADYLKSHGLTDQTSGNQTHLNRAIGRHIFQESIRVLGKEASQAGPIMTYIRLMATLAASSWDHPAMGTELAQYFTKIPNKLYDNIRNVYTGLVYNGQIVLQNMSQDANWDWSDGTYDDKEIIASRAKLTCPFEAQYDSTPFSQPMIDLAEINGCTFWINRLGYPVFVPKNFSFRPSGHGFRSMDTNLRANHSDAYTKENGEWFLAYGGSIDGYSHSINADAVFTQCWITVNTALNLLDGSGDSGLTLVTGGTGYENGKLTAYGGYSGNRLGLALTSGVQQVQTISLDNQVLGLDWDTEGGWGNRQIDNDGNTVTFVRPVVYDGSPVVKKGSTGEKSVTAVQRTINFFFIRLLLTPIRMNGNTHYNVPTDGKFDDVTRQGLIQLQGFLGITADGIYGRSTYHAIQNYLDTNEHFLKNDIFWYVSTQGQEAWSNYLFAVLGLPIIVKSGKFSLEGDTAYTADQSAMNKEQEAWTRGFAKSVLNAGNRAVDDSINQATARSITVNIADPRIQPGDIIWCEVPGFLGSRDVNGDNKPPFTNGIYVTSLSRQMDLTTGTYTGEYSGYRFRGHFNRGRDQTLINAGYDFVT